MKGVFFVSPSSRSRVLVKANFVLPCSSLKIPPNCLFVFGALLLEAKISSILEIEVILFDGFLMTPPILTDFFGERDLP
jgi:hypothetical protein